MILLSGGSRDRPKKNYKLLISPYLCYRTYSLKRLVCKDEYFTLEFNFTEHNYDEERQEIDVDHYVTFKYNKFAEDFFLHRYGIVTKVDGIKHQKTNTRLKILEKCILKIVISIL